MKHLLLSLVMALPALQAQAQAAKQTPENAHKFLQQVIALGTTGIEVRTRGSGSSSNSDFNWGPWEARVHPYGPGDTLEGSFFYAPFPVTEAVSQQCSTAFVFTVRENAERSWSVPKYPQRDPRSFSFVSSFKMKETVVGEQRPEVQWAKAGKVQQERQTVTIDDRIRLTFNSEDMAKRVHYAMEFLRTACDKTAGTGF